MRKCHKGKYTPKNPKKYIGDTKNIVYRSSWEKKVFLKCDNNKNILKWGSEIKAIPYYSTIDQKMRRYFPDLWVQYKNVQGDIINDCIEIKPFKETQPPKKTGGKNSKKRFILESLTHQKNTDKWKACDKWCKDNGWNFRLMTENEIFQ